MPKEAPAERRRRRAVVAGYSGDETTARGLLADPEPAVRELALAALARMGRLRPGELTRAFADPQAAVRRRVMELSAHHDEPDPVMALADPDPSVVEAAAWALGERFEQSHAGAADAMVRLAEVAAGHEDPLAREAAVAALGAIGDPDGLAAVLQGLSDRPAIRRRAVVALAAFEGPEVDAALDAARGDRDWQVRQAADEIAESSGGR